MLTRGRPDSAGHLPGEPLPPQGRAARFACEKGEILRLAASETEVAERLLALGAAGVGGFIDGGADGEGVWLVRASRGDPLALRLREKRPWASEEAMGLGRDLARALEACEAASLSAGPLTPDAIELREGRATVRADGLVGALLGDTNRSAVRASLETVSPLWTPPEQAEGAPWDAAANRYALGLLLYRVIAGAHPFAGAGLRHALAEATHREAAPFEEAIAHELPGGLQSLVLRMLDPDKAARPARASTIAADLARFAAGEATGQGPQAIPTETRASSRGVRPRSGEPHASGSSGAGPRASGSSGAGPHASGSSGESPRASGSSGAISRVAARRESVDRPSADRVVKARAPESPSRPSFLERARALWPIGAGAAIAAACFALLSPAPPPPPQATVAAPPSVLPLDAAHTTGADCASCHARQAAEWRRSVMAHSVKSPLFNALESLIEEQVGRDDDCPNGAGILRRAGGGVCRDATSGLAITGSGGEHWCINCHSPMENIAITIPPWDGRPGGDARSRRPVRDLLGDRAMEGISCSFCHEVHGPVGRRGSRGYEGNATWTSFVTGATFAARPEDDRGLLGIANSGYDLRPEDFLLGRGSRPSARDALDPVVHQRALQGTRGYLDSSEFCGACHDVRLFGSDVFGAAKGEHFKRLRNAYSEWSAWASDERRKGRAAATCQGCHMSTYPGVCAPDPSAPDATPPNTDPECPAGTHFVQRAPGAFPSARVANNSPAPRDVVTHYFSGVDLPLAEEFGDAIIDEPNVDLHDIPLSARKRRDLLLRHTFRFGVGVARRAGQSLEVPIEIENTGAGHRVPAGFSQEREFWVHLTVKDGDGRLLYEVGRVDRGDEDLRDKIFDRVTTSLDARDARGRPEGLFGADVRDGPDAPAWQPPPLLGGTSFRGKGLINFQNGFLRCVKCIGIIGADGECRAAPGQEGHRADRFADGNYDLDTGECRSNLSGTNALFETYFPVGSLDASRGLAKGPDAIIDTRSVPPGVPLRYTYELGTEGRRGPFRIEAELLFRSFPPFLVKAFASYEREAARRGLRPSGPLVTEDMLRKLEVVAIGRARAEVR